MTRIFKWGEGTKNEVEIELSDDGSSIKFIKPRKTATAILIKGELEEFATKLFTSLAKAKDKYGVPVFTVSESELNDCIAQFVEFLKGKEEIPLEFEEEKKTEAPTPKQVQLPLVPIEAREAKEEEKEKKEEIPTVDASKLVLRFQELSKTIKEESKIYDMLEKEFNVPREVIYQLLPARKEEVKTEKMLEEVKLLTTISETRLGIEEIEGYEYITSKHLEWLDVLAQKVYNIDRITLLNRYLKDAEKTKQKVNVKTGALIAKAIFDDATKHNVIQFVRRRVYHLIFVYRENSELKYIECVADKNIEGLKINRCYRIPELNNIEARLVAMTFPPFLRDISMYSNLKLITKIESIGDLPAIPIAGPKVFEPITLRDAIEKARESPIKEIVDCIYVTIKQVNEWSQGSGVFLAVHDGVDPNLPIYACKIKLPYDNPFGLDEGIIANSVEKTILCYGILQYKEPVGRISEGLIITPMYIGFVE